MRQTIYLLLLWTLGFIDCQGQSAIEFGSIRYGSAARKTLSLLEMPEISAQIMPVMDSLSRKYFHQPMVKNKDFKIYEVPPFNSNGTTTKNKIEKTSNSSTTSFQLELTELPLNDLMKVPNLDSSFIEQLLKKQTVAFLHFNAKLIAAGGSVLLNRQLNVVLSRNRKKQLIGFLHPDYLIYPKTLLKLLETCLPILVDSSNETEIIQMTTIPAVMADNFIQPFIKAAAKLPANLNRGNIIQYEWNHELQYLRYQAPAYEPIVLRGKNQTTLPASLVEAIHDNKFQEPLFLREESRDILADKNYLLQCVVSVELDAYANSGFFRNKKTGLVFHFLPNKYHVLMEDKDTLAIFSVEVNKKYPDNKRFYHQLYYPVDSTVITVSNKVREGVQIYNYELNGLLKGQPFQIRNSGMYGSTEMIREIFYKNQLACIAQGSYYPELLAAVDESIDVIILNQLLLLAFSSLF